MSALAFGIVTASATHIKVDGLQDYRSIGAFSFLGRYRVIDFPISSMSNSGIDRIQVYSRRKPLALVEHLGTGRQYNINSKRGKLQMVFSEFDSSNYYYNTDIAGFYENIELIERMHQPYVVIAPNYMVYIEDYDNLVKQHIATGADITLLYHKVHNAKESFLSCDALTLNKQKGVEQISKNRGADEDKNIFMDTYVMSKDLFIELIHTAKKISSMYTLAQIVNEKAMSSELDIRGIEHTGFFASITDFKSYYDANLSLIDKDEAMKLFQPNWTIYTKTTDAAPTQYFAGASAKNSVIANGCAIEGTIENSIIGRNVVVKKGAVIKNSIVLDNTIIGENVILENQVVDKWVKIIHENKLIATAEKPGYVRRDDIL